MAHYSAIKKDKLVIPAVTWMNLQGIMLSENSNPKRLHTVCDAIRIMFGKLQSYRNRKQISRS